jgi:hypothetical protein
MKFRISLLSLFIALAALTASAADFGIHGGYYWGDLKQWAVGADAQWPIGPAAISPNIDYSRKNGVGWWFASGDIDLRFATGGGGPAYWIGAGPTYGYVTYQGDHDSEWGWDANGGISWAMGGLKPYVSGRYVKIKDFRSTGAFIGLRF